MKKKSMMMLIVLLAPFFFISPSVNADSDDPAIIGFDFENGLSTNETITLSGSIEYDIIPDSVVWTIISDDITLSGHLTESLEEISSQSNRLLWSWYTELDVIEISVCTCYFTVTVYSGQLSWSSTRALFIGDTLRSGLLIFNPQDSEWAHRDVIVTGWSSHPTVWADSETRFFTYPASSSADACSQQGDSDMTQLLSVINTTGEFSTTIDISSLEDGWHSMYVENYDPSGLAFAQQCVEIRVNNLPPEISLVGNSFFVESNGEIIFDASASEDPYWGREGIEYMWVLRKPSHSGQTPLDIQINGGSYSLLGNSGGNYSLTVRITDEGGISSTTVFEFDIENSLPNAIASVSGTPMLDGSTIRLQNGDSWELDASDSSDTENDIAGLRCVWKIDYEPMYEGCERMLTWPEDASLEAILTLDVIDDDEAFTSISVLLIHPDSSEPLPYPVIVLLISALFLFSAILLRYRSSDDSGGIPTWDSD
tara:strand:+ start:20040 stop:21485 length:1446 start_codon:yes stop_codon:yes gene_type:complete